MFLRFPKGLEAWAQNTTECLSEITELSILIMNVLGVILFKYTIHNIKVELLQSKTVLLKVKYYYWFARYRLK